MAEEFDFIAPNGRELQGTYESVERTCVIAFHGPDPSRDYDFVGDDEIFWDGGETKEVFGTPLFLDDEGLEWMAHHLIPAGSEPLSTETLECFSREYHIGVALDSAKMLSNRLEVLSEEADLAGDMEAVDAILDRLKRTYETAKQANIIRRDHEIAAQSAAASEE